MMGGALLTPGLAALVLFGAFFALIALRVPVAFALGLACLPAMIIEPRLSPMIVFNETFKAYNSFILLAVPFFLLTANLMNVGGITIRLLRLSRALVGHLPGGLAQCNVVLSFFFAGISGSSTADASSLGKIFIPAQVKEGYDLSFSVAITAVSSVLAVVIPPSILMIVWGGTLSVSIGALFLAGIVPGMLLAGVQMATVHGYARLRGYPTSVRSTFGEFACGGVRRGPGADDAAHHHRRQGLRLVHRHRVRGHRRALRRDAVDVRLSGDGPEGPAHARCWTPAASPGSRCSAWAPPASSAGCSPTTRSRRCCSRRSASWGMGLIATGFFVAFAFLVVGCFLDAIPAIIIVGTILEPITMAVHMDPVQFAMIGIVSLAFGLVTPPYGLCLMISCAIAKVRLTYVLKDVVIMLMPMLGVLALTIVFPEVVLFLPRLVSPEFLK